MKSPFDLGRVRRNWERAESHVPERRADRLEGTRAPMDPLSAGRELLAEIPREIIAQFPDKAEVLMRFVARATSTFAEMERDAQAAAEGKSFDPARQAELRGALLRAIHDLEDLCEAFGRARG